MNNKKLFHHQYHLFMNLKLTQKLVFGYLFIVIIPVVSFSIFFLSLNYHTSKESYVQSQKQELYNFSTQFHSLLNQLANYSYFFENNSEILSYLDGEYTTVSDILYHYVGDISDIFDCYAYDSRISSITVYGKKENLLSIHGRLEPMNNFSDQNLSLSEIQLHKNGQWLWSEQGELIFYKSIYDRNYNYTLGILEIKTNLKKLLYHLTENLNYSWYFYPENNQDLLFLYQDENLKLCNTEERSHFFNMNLVITDELDLISYRIAQPLFRHDYLKTHISVYLLLSFVVLVLYSFLYYLIAGSLTHRLVKFSNSISQQQPKDLKPYICTTTFHDEIGNTITTYNQLVSRINELIHNNYEVSLRMKAAQYYALQAQIKPHFLYNILENIRMSSDQNGDPVTAHMTMVVGKYMRYVMNNSTAPAPLETELQSARDYLEVNKIRLGRDLTFDISIQAELENIFCPRFALQPLLENSIKHGFQKGKRLHISLQISGINDYEYAPTVYIEILDNGSGIAPEHLKNIQDVLYSDSKLPCSTHVGLRNVNDRLKAFHPHGLGMQIESQLQKGTLIKIPLERKDISHESTDC